jgi:hypothetical protein
MAAELTIYSIYRLNGERRYFLLRTERPEFSNASQVEEDMAVAAEQDVRDRMLHRISEFFGHGGLEFIGELQNYPVGEAIYSAAEKARLEIYYIGTQFGHPWIILGDAASEEAFLSEIEADEDLARLGPTGQPIKIEVTFFTESDLL